MLISPLCSAAPWTRPLEHQQRCTPLKKGVRNAGQKSLEVVQAPGKVSQEEILEASQVMMGDIGGNEVSKAHSSSCSTHSVRLSDPFNDGLLGEKFERV